MIPFKHRTEIESNSPTIRAAYAIARKAHLESGQMRGKGGFPYLVHPIMVYDLLQYFGETSEIVLAAALLHDAREDGPEYKNNPHAMREELEEKLRQEGVKDAKEIASQIDNICGELTNDREMHEGKQTWQIEHAGRISMTACKVKLFDQMASILDNIMLPDEPGSNKGGKAWSMKALAVVKAIASERPQLDFYRDMFKVLFKYNITILSAPDEATAAVLRGGFLWDTALQEAHRIHKNNTIPLPVADRILSRSSQEVAKGVLQVGFDLKGKVVEYACLCDPSSGTDDVRNAAAIALMGGIESASISRRVTIGTRQVLEGRLVRINKIKPPMDAEEFIAQAMQAGALATVLATQVRDKARAMAPAPRLPT